MVGYARKYLDLPGRAWTSKKEPNLEELPPCPLLAIDL